MYLIQERWQYPLLLSSLETLSEADKIQHLRNLARNDLFFLLRYAMKRADMDRQWLFERCREVQQNPNGYLDLWAREHYKSTIITFGLTIQDILNNPEVTVGIFSHTRPIAKGFLRQIKRELEDNEDLKRWFPDILWSNPKRDAPVWSEDSGLVVKRRTNPKESTVEAFGLVDGQPTSKHYSLMVYDDVVTIDSVTNAEMIGKVNTAWEISRNLSSENGGVTRYIGTRYHFNDSYRLLMQRQAATIRLYPATVDGSVDGEPVLLTSSRLAEKRREMGPYTFACQMLQNPKADETQGFHRDWLNFYADPENFKHMNRYILVDPANEKKKSNDYTAIWVWGLGPDGNYYTLYMIRDRLNLTERTDLLFKLHEKYQPKGVGYEKYGKDSDIQHIQTQMSDRNYNFAIQEVAGKVKKEDRIKRLIPDWEQGRIWLPTHQHYTDYEHVTRDMVEVFLVEEFDAFPVAIHDDMMDVASRIYDLPHSFPKRQEDEEDRPQRYMSKPARRGWMTR